MIAHNPNNLNNLNNPNNPNNLGVRFRGEGDVFDFFDNDWLRGELLTFNLTNEGYYGYEGYWGYKGDLG